MEFEDAITELKKGERIKRAHWKTAYLKKEKDKILMHMGFKKPWIYLFRNNDVLANDWLIDTSHMYVDDDNKSLLRPLDGHLRFNS